MPDITLDDTLAMHYEDDYFGEPWVQPETMLLVHGVAESGLAWYGWVPHLARRFRVIRPDLRGFGASTAPPPGYPWSPAGFAADLARLLDALQLDAVHVAGAKVGGTVAMQFAADFPRRTRTLAVFSGPVRARNTGGSADLTTFAQRVRTDGVRAWAAETQRARLGSAVPEAHIEWWTDFMASTDPRVCIEVTGMAGRMDISEALPRIQAPTLVATTEKSALASVETVRQWQQQIRDSELLVLPGDSYHIAAADPDGCARRLLDFIDRRAS